MIKAAILGISSSTLTKEEIELIKTHQPYGIILFKRNCVNETQTKELNLSIKNIAPNCKIFIDQEGGRVARLKKPDFIEFPPANQLTTPDQAYQNYFNMGLYLKSLGIDVNCAPMADLFFTFADNIVGDRSFGEDPNKVAELAAAAASGLIDSGITPIIKHIPGHGRALVDSHLELPIVETDLKTLEQTDFAVFKKLKYLPMAMTAHVIYNALDPDLAATVSPKAISYIRKEIGFTGILISDDINMKALQGSLKDLTNQAFEAGCDIILHCNGNIEEMREVLDATKIFTE
jgi:beta-glucosidase-like glycosyl hydrolase